jgi:RNA-dependent RNA polymerase
MRLEFHLDESNSVLRRFSGQEHHFLRVSIREEDMNTLFNNDREMDMSAFLKTRFGGIFASDGGLKVGGRTFKFLGHSMSSLRSHSTFFVSDFRHDGVLVTAESIRQSLGDFSNGGFSLFTPSSPAGLIRPLSSAAVMDNPARMMARISQAFTATSGTLVLDVSQIDAIPDITSTTGSCFTDGVGKISSALAREIEEILAARRPERKKNRVAASAYQVRLFRPFPFKN